MSNSYTICTIDNTTCTKNIKNFVYFYLLQKYYKILQNGYKWLQTCNHIIFTKVASDVSMAYTGRAGIYARKGAANELRLRSCIRELHWSCIYALISNSQVKTRDLDILRSYIIKM